MIQQFINREAELEALEKAYREERSALFIIYGRRRIGKTELVKHFIKNKENIYFLADERPDIANIKEIQKSMGEFLRDTIFEKAEINEWVELFEEFTKRSKKKTVIVIDEFPYLIHTNKSIPSVFQKIWDNNLSRKDVFLILLGSSISIMEEHTLSYKSPLYGRRSGQLELKPLKIRHLFKFFTKYTLEDIIKVWSLTDGIPLYLMKLDSEKSFMKNLEQNVFKIGKFLYQESENLLKQELREVANYFHILKSISFGRNKYGEIVNFTNLDKTIISKYLDNLIKLHLIRKEFPITQKRETRNASYTFEDNYFNFWFRFVYPNKQLTEEGKQKIIIENIADEMNAYFSFVFEKACKEFVWYLDLPIKFNKVGKWWHKDKEIDLVCLDELNKEALFIEIKWSDLKEKDAERVIDELKMKAEYVDWNNSKRKEYYGVIAKSFSKRPKSDCLLFDLRDLENACRHYTRRKRR